jgi:hypothetical protein
VGYKVLAHVHEHSRAVGQARHLLLELAWLASNDTWDCWPSRETLALRLGCSRRTITRLLSELVALGELRVVPKGGPIPLRGLSAGRSDRCTSLYVICREVIAVSPSAHNDWTPVTSREPNDWTKTTRTTGQKRHERLDTRAREPVIRNQSLEPVTRSPSSNALAPAKIRDELFDALAASCGIAVPDLTRSARGALNRALKDLREVDATPAEVSARAGRYRERWPKVSLTPSALAKHWAELTDGSGPLDVIDRAYLAAKKAGR